MKEDRHYQKYLVSLLQDPMLFRNCTELALDSFIAGEEDARGVIFLTAIGSLVENANHTSFNLLVNSKSGAGKDHTVSTVMKVLPKYIVEKRTRISPTVLTYWHNATFEPEWTWQGKVLYLEDVSNSVLNSPVFKVFSSGGSFATIVKDQKAVDIEIKGKPSIIITSASADPEPELVRRFLVVNLTETSEQTQAIMEKWADMAVHGGYPMEDNCIKDHKEALKLLKSYKVKIPFGKNIPQFLPKEHLIARTMLPRFADYIKASAILHQYAREKDVDEFIIAEKQDYETARKVILATSCNNKLIPLTQSQQDLVSTMKQLGKCVEGEGLNEKERGWTIAELVSKVHCIGRTQLYSQLHKLAEQGFLEKDSFKGDYDRKPSLTFAYKEQIPLELPRWKELIQ